MGLARHPINLSSILVAISNSMAMISDEEEETAGGVESEIQPLLIK
jgi:hypothetical protein